MEERLQQINTIIANMPGVNVVDPFKEDHNGMLTGHVIIDAHGVQIPFTVHIGQFYPFQFHNVESISFVNKDLLPYDHVMENGAICIHTLHCPDLEQKLKLDINGVNQWIKDIYISQTAQTHYEHIIVPYSQFNDTDFYFLFTEVDPVFQKGDFGYMNFSFLAVGKHEKKSIHTLLVTDFKVAGTIVKCGWSDYYHNRKTGVGLYVYIETPPVTNKRFIIKSWTELEAYVDADFMRFLHSVSSKIKRQDAVLPIPLFIGYKIPSGEIHWQCAAIDSTNFPNYGEKIPGTNSYQTRFYDEGITWLQTKNCSYHYFFGRGALSEKITKGTVLIIGVGAIGSTLATTLVRGGCRQIALADYDIKEPENGCRAEYSFSTGLNGKVNDLTKTLSEMSPFVKIWPLEDFTDHLKFFVKGGNQNKEFQELLNKFDLIIDCSADNDMAFILDCLKLETQVVSLSITNHARELVCVTKPHLYDWLKEIYNTLQQDHQDFYNPTGCWSPTFKATHNDIALMVHQAVKKINHSFNTNKPLGNFYLRAEADDDVNITLHKF